MTNCNFLPSSLICDSYSILNLEVKPMVLITNILNISLAEKYILKCADLLVKTENVELLIISFSLYSSILSTCYGFKNIFDT